MTKLEKKLMTALAEVMSLVDTEHLDQDEELIYAKAVDVLADAAQQCDDCVDY